MLLVAGWLLTALALVALRVPHLFGPLDDPHSWRQCDTAHYSLDFYRNGIDLLHPAVCWLGGYRTLILEFPLPEAMSALLYRLRGPDPMWDRVVSLAFFVVAGVYLRAFVRLWTSRRVAWLALIAYLAFPLGQFFSRAAQVDFVAAAFAHALLFHATRAIERRSLFHAAVAAGSGALAAMIKAPYVIPVLGPLALVVLAGPRLRGALVTGGVLAVTAVAFMLWRRHVDTVNAAAPEWGFLPGYYKEVNPLWWYVGTWAQRQDPSNWIRLARRFVLDVLTPIGALLVLLGCVRWRGPEPRRIGLLPIALAWLAGSLAYLLVFFPLNVIHNYYQVPFLAPLAILVALGADLIWERGPRLKPMRIPLGAFGFVAFVVAAVVSVYTLGYYRVDWLRVEAGRLIAEGVPRKDLIVVADHGTEYSDPRLLFRSDHAGWPIAIGDLERVRLERLAELGARWVAVVTDPEHPGLQPPPFLERGSAGRYPVQHAGRQIGTLSIYDLGRVVGPESMVMNR